ncbi:MAG: hypothetical protein ABH859_05750 [Pseudomonadota bacterium]
MRKFLVVLVVVFAVALPSFSFADAGYDGGFYIKNSEDTFKLKINGRIQPEFFFTKQTIAPTKQASFGLRRAETSFTATIREKLSFGVGFKHATNSQDFSGVNITGGTMSYEFVPEFTITAGMVGLPLSMMADMSSKWFLLTRSPITDVQDDGVEDFTIPRLSFSVPDGLGLNFSGSRWKFYYSLSVVNGAESNYTWNTNNRFSFGARVGFNILGSVGGSMTDFACSDAPNLAVSLGSMYQAKRNYFVGANNTTNPTQIGYLWTSSAGIALRWGGFSLTTEGYWRRTKINAQGAAVWWRPKLDDIGYYAAVGYYIVPKTFEVALQAGQIIREGPDNNSHSFGGGLNWYIFDNNLKMQLSYIWTEDYDDIWGAANSNHIHNIMLMTSAAF